MCAGCYLKIGYVAFVNADKKKLPKAMTEEDKILLPEGSISLWER